MQRNSDIIFFIVNTTLRPTSDVEVAIAMPIRLSENNSGELVPLC